MFAKNLNLQQMIMILSKFIIFLCMLKMMQTCITIISSLSRHHNKVVDLSMQIRYSGLPNNAALEMYPAVKKRTESNVVILVQSENGARQTGTFLPSGI